MEMQNHFRSLHGACVTISVVWHLKFQTGMVGTLLGHSDVTAILNSERENARESIETTCEGEEETVQFYDAAAFQVYGSPVYKHNCKQVQDHASYYSPARQQEQLLALPISTW